MISNAVILVIAIFGLLLLILACQRLFRARFLAAGGSAFTGSLLLAVAALLFVVSLNLHTYAPTDARSVRSAEIVFEQRAPQTFNATLTQVPNGEIQMFVLAGDEWQLDARVLKWKGWANLFGLDAQYRLERVSGRYRDITQERTAERTVYPLAENPGDGFVADDAGQARSPALRRRRLRQCCLHADVGRRPLRDLDHPDGPDRPSGERSGSAGRRQLEINR